MNGTCFCGAVPVEFTGAPEEMRYCHCGYCLSYTGSPLTAFYALAGQERGGDARRGVPGKLRQTPKSQRRFCTLCGGHVLTEHPGMGFTDVYAAVFPTLPFRPLFHLNYAETVLPLKDGLPKLKDFPADAGGSGEMIPEKVSSRPGYLSATAGWSIS